MMRGEHEVSTALERLRAAVGEALRFGDHLPDDDAAAEARDELAAAMDDVARILAGEPD